MADLGVHLADLPGIVKWPSPLRQRVEELFTKVVKVSGELASAKVAWTKSPPTLAAHDLLQHLDARSRYAVPKW